MKHKERIAWGIVVSALVLWNVVGQAGSDLGEKPDRSDSVGSERFKSHRERRSAKEGAGGGLRREKADGGVMERSGGVRSRSLTALRSGDPVIRMSAFLQVISFCDEEELDLVRGVMDELKLSGISLAGEEDLMRFRAGQLKGGKLLADRTGRPEDFAELASVRRQYEGWIQADPQAAGRWLDGLPPGRFRDQMAVAYIAASTKDDPWGSLGLVATLHPSQQAVAGGRLIASTTTEDASALLRTLEASPGGTGGPYLETMFTTLAGKVAEGNDPTALSLIEEHLNQPYVSDSALSLVSAAKAKFDPNGALDWAAGLETRRPDKLNQGQVVNAVIQALPLERLETAESWAAAQPDARALLYAIEQRKETLLDRQGEVNKYDRDD